MGVPFILLFVLALLAIPVLAVVAFVRTNSLRRDVAALKEQLARLKGSRSVELAPDATSTPRAAETARAKRSGEPAQAERLDAEAGAEVDVEAGTTAPPRAPAQAARRASRIATAPAVPGFLQKDIAWAMQNWVAVMASASLALAGIFLVIYGVEQGLITPAIRVAFSLALGAALIGAGEVVRRRGPALKERQIGEEKVDAGAPIMGDTRRASFETLGAILSASGLVVLYGAVLAAHALYDLVGGVTAFGGLILASLLGLALGGRHSPFLSGFALFGIGLAPWVIGGDPAHPLVMPLYYLALPALGLAFGWFRSWPAMPALGGVLALGLGAIPVLATAGGEDLVGMLWFASLSGMMACAISAQPAAPRSLLGVFIARVGRGVTSDAAQSETSPTTSRTGWTRRGIEEMSLLGLCGVFVATLLAIIGLYAAGPSGLTAGFVLLGLAVGLLGLIKLRPGVFEDSVGWVLGALAVLVVLSMGKEALPGLALTGSTYGYPLSELRLENAEAWNWIILLFGAVGLAIIYAFRIAQDAGRFSTPNLRAGYGFAAALLPGILFGVVEYVGRPGDAIGLYPWALVLMGAAALLTLAAGWAARVDGEDKARCAFFVIGAGGLMALALNVLLADAALSIALAIAVVLAHQIDRRLDLPYVEIASSLAVTGLVGRALLFPGLSWAWDAPWAQMLPAFLAPILAMLVILATRGAPRRYALRDAARIGLALLVPALFTVILTRLEAGQAEFYQPSHWSVALISLSVFLSAVGLLPKRRRTGLPADLRAGVAMAGTWGAGAFVILACLASSPLFHLESVIGAPVLNTLLVSNLLPGVVFLLVLKRKTVGELNGGRAAKALLWAGTGIICSWIFLAIRHAWHGEQISPSLGVLQGEQYSYTVALVLAGIAAILATQVTAIRNRVLPQRLRRAGLVIIGVAVAKVFLVDASGLTGILRVLSFLLLGLVLAGLAWLDQRLRGSPAAP